MSKPDFRELLTVFPAPGIEPPGAADGWQPVATFSGKWMITAQAPQSTTMKDYTTALRVCNIADTAMPGLPGAFCLLPAGVQLQHKFQDKVRRAYEKYGLEEYDYPVTMPLQTVANYLETMNLSERVVYASSKTAAPGDAWMLNPTGEPVIYPHWKQLLRRGHPLPIRVYRNTTYFRPAKGKHTESIFRCPESSQIFEFHCAYGSSADAQAAMPGFINMQQELFREFHLPVICSQRPLSTNNSRVSRNTIGFDALLPTGKSIQLASIYEQDDLLSKVFDIRIGKAGYTSHVTGYISRRVLLVQLLAGLTANSYFILPADMQPVQVLVIIKDGAPSSLQSLLQSLADKGIRAAVETAPSGKKIQQLRKRYRQLCAALDVIVIPPVTDNEEYKIIITRYDAEQEKILYMNSLSSLAGEITAALQLYDEYYQHAMSAYGGQSTTWCSAVTNVSDAIKAGKIAACALSDEHAAISGLEAAVSAEVLGFTSSAHAEACIVTQQPVNTIAFVARRI